MRKITFILLAVSVFLSPLNAQEIDQSFKPTIGGAVDIYDMALQPDQKLLVAGSMILAGDEPVNRLIRLNQDGSLDQTFMLDPTIQDKINEIALQSDGKILVVVQTTPSYKRSLVRLNSNGSIDNSYGFVSDNYDQIRGLTIDDENQLYFYDYNTIHKIFTNGVLDESFSITTAGPSAGMITKIGLTIDNKLLISGRFTSINGVEKNGLGRVSKEGVVDNTFDIGTGTDREIVNFTSLTSGKYLIMGRFATVSGSAYNQLARLNYDGSIDNTFNNNAGFNTGNGINDVAVDYLNRIILVGNFQTPTKRIIRLTPNGDLDTSFDEGSGFTSEILSANPKQIIIGNDGRMLVSGSFSRYDDFQSVGLARIFLNGDHDSSYKPALAGAPTVNVTAKQNDGKFLIGGSFLRIAESEKVNIARLNSDGTPDIEFITKLGASSKVKSIAIQNDGKILVGGEFNQINGSYKSGIVRLNPNGSTDESFSVTLQRQYASDGVFKFHVQEDGKIIIAGAFFSINGTAKKHLARLNVDGSLDETFNVNDDIPARINDLEILPNGNFMVAGNEPNDPGFISMRNGNGNEVTSFKTPDISLARITAIEVQSDGKVLVGGFAASGNSLLSNAILYRLNADGSLDNTFNITTSTTAQYVYEIATLPGGDILVGNSESGLVRYNSNGYLDTDFSWSTNMPVMQITSDESNYFLSGSFSKIGENDVYGLARLTSTLVNSPSKVSVGEDFPSLSWVDNSSNETAFEVFRSNQATSGFSLLATLEPNTNSFEDETIEDGLQYFYQVRASKGNEKSSFSNTVAFPAYNLPAVTGLEISAIGLNNINLKWTNSSFYREYIELVRSEEGQPDVILNLKSNINNYNDVGLRAGTSYTYTLRNISATAVSDPVSLTINTLSGSLKRTGAVSFVIGSDAYIGLGRDETGFLQDFSQIDVTNNAATAIANFPGVARENAVAFVLDEMAYIGLGEDALGNPLADLYKYNPVNDTWTALNEFGGSARSAAVAFVVGGKAYAGTGYNGITELNDFYQYDVNEDTWTQTAAFTGDKRREAVTFSIDNNAFVVGGFYVEGGTFQLSDVQKFDATTETWKEVVFADNNLSFNYATAFVYGNSGYIAYGNKNDIVKFNPSDYSTSNLGDVLSIDDGEIGDTRSDALAFTVNGTPYFSGGRSGFFTEIIYGDFYSLALLNNEPTSIELSANTFDENVPGNVSIGFLTATDADETDTYTFSLVPGNGFNDIDNNLFAINGAELLYIGSEGANYEENDRLRIFIEVSDNKGGSFKKAFTIIVLDNNDIPQITNTQTTFVLNENPEINTVIGTLTATDEDNDYIFFSVVDGADSAVIINENGEILVTDPRAFNYELNTTLIFSVVAEDSESSSDPVEITIQIIDVNDSPTISLGQGIPEVAENAENGTFVIGILAEDEDGDDLTFELYDESGIFSINENREIVVSNSILLDFETTSSHLLNVTTSDDSGASASIEFNVAVLNVNEPPTISVSPEEVIIDENTEIGTLITNLSGIDEDGDAIIFTIISGNSDNTFRIDSNDKIVTNINAFNINADTLYTLVVNGSDGEFSDEVQINIKVISVPDIINSIANEMFSSKPYPNPIYGGFLYITLLSHNVDEIIVLDNLGRKFITKWSVENNKLRVDFSNLEQGLYTLRIISFDTAYDFKISRR